MRNSDIRALYYITHIDNLPSILDRGILSHEKIKAADISHNRIYDNSIVKIRRGVSTPAGRGLWHYANLFFQSRNPMLFRVINEAGRQNLAVLRVSNTVLQKQGIFITDGIAANKLTHIYPQSEGLEILQTQQVIIQSSSGLKIRKTQQEILQSLHWISWQHCEELDRKLMAECLVPNQVEQEYIQRFIVADHTVAASLQARLSPSNLRKLVVADAVRNNIFTPFFD